MLQRWRRPERKTRERHWTSSGSRASPNYNVLGHLTGLEVMTGVRSCHSAPRISLWHRSERLTFLRLTSASVESINYCKHPTSVPCTHLLNVVKIIEEYLHSPFAAVRRARQWHSQAAPHRSTDDRNTSPVYTFPREWPKGAALCFATNSRSATPAKATQPVR